MRNNDHQRKVEEAVAFLREKGVGKPDFALILGTGLGRLAEDFDDAAVIPCKTIPGFPQPTVAGHEGNVITGILGGRRVVALQGRLHYYEGYSAREVAFPVRVFSLLGAGTLIVTNASGGLKRSFFPGTVMVIRDHINFMPDNPLRGPNIDEWGPRYPDLSQAYDRDLIEMTVACATRLGMTNVVTGVYAAIPGPSLETPAETRFLKQCGAHAVGMSTVPEVIVARHAGMRVLGLSLVANVNDPDDFQPILLDDVIAQVEKAGPAFRRLVLEVLKSPVKLNRSLKR